eukprot:13335471-Ditylum_brightwellii.AAC.1
MTGRTNSSRWHGPYGQEFSASKDTQGAQSLVLSQAVQPVVGEWIAIEVMGVTSPTRPPLLASWG